MNPSLPRRGLLALLGGGAVAGCGFQPVYMPTATNKPGVAERELAAIEIPVIPDRPGQVMRQALQERLGSDGGAAHKYQLRVSYWISGEGEAILPDNTSTRVRLIGNAVWELVALDPTHTRLTRGSARSFDAVNVFNQQYFAADLENEAAQRRIANALADQLAFQLAAYFRQRDIPPPGKSG